MASPEPVHDDAVDGAAAAKKKRSAVVEIMEAVNLVTEDYVFDGTSAYLIVKNGTGGVRTIDVGRAEFSRWVARAVREMHRKFVTADAIKTARLAIEAHAESFGIRPAPTVRVAEKGDAILIDLGDDKWRCVRVTASGWDVVPHPADGPYFLRTPLMAALPVPVPREEREGGEYNLLWRYVLVPREQRLLLLGALLHKYSPKGPYLIEAFGGEQGSTKTTAQKAIKSLTDPSRPGPKELSPTSLRSPPREERTIKAAARGAHVLGFDNVSYISEEVADLLCRVSTGADLGGFKLYTDSDEDVYNAIRPVMLNGIPDVVRRADLADRAILYTLHPPKKRIAEKKLWSGFKQEYAEILGSLLDLLVLVLANQEKAELPEGYDVRMMDFALFGEALGLALEREPGEFTRAYHANRQSHAQDIAQGDLLWGPLTDALNKHDGVLEGTPNQLRAALELEADGANSNKLWPKTGQAMGAYMRRMSPSWRSAGIIVEERGKSRDGIVYEIRRSAGVHIEVHTPQAVTGSGVANHV